ncbi:MAG: Stp1/IreP family PP2C-type Ser/Thr phosphatase [Clostridia bacterium]|nr:Stp1/IreP family PP2C-type Ser/Thr phosphatase [Clostridia bacterium]
MQIYYQTDVGLIRRNNQDYCVCEKISDELAWAIVCDGMGGANGGNVASKEACIEIDRILKEELNEKTDPEELRELMEEAVLSANSKVYEMSCETISLSGMGTTVELVVVRNDTLHIVHAGDSRVYKISADDIIDQVTTDHSLVQQLVELGQITPEEARYHPSKNFITRALGVEPELEIDYITVPFDHGDMILICTDGLSNYFNADELIAAVRSFKNKDEVAQGLVDIAKDCGGSDNITVAILINE